MGWNLAQRIVLTNLANAWLHSSAAVVDVPHPCGCQRQVGMPSSIRITFQGKQGRLRVALLDLLPRHNATPCVRPTVGTVLKLRNLPAEIHRFKAQTSERALQRWDHARDYGVLGQKRFQHVQNRSVAE